MFGVIPCTLAEAEEDELDRGLYGLVGSAESPPYRVDHTRYLDTVNDQKWTNSCVGQWFSNAVYLAGQAQGKPVARPSARWAYTVARYLRNPGADLLDLGSSARLMCEGAAKHGIVADSRLPFVPADINEPPPFDADVAGGDALFTGYYRAGADAELLKRALCLGHFPGVAIAVHQNFVDWATDGVYSEPLGAFRGYHMLTLVGYRPGAFRVLNSWGTSWGDGGFCWMSDYFITSQYAFDRYVVTAAPASR